MICKQPFELRAVRGGEEQCRVLGARCAHAKVEAPFGFVAGPTRTSLASSLTERIIHPDAHIIWMFIEVYFQCLRLRECVYNSRSLTNYGNRTDIVSATVRHRCGTALWRTLSPTRTVPQRDLVHPDFVFLCIGSTVPNSLLGDSR